MVDVHQRYRDRDVIFLGITPETADELRNIRRFLEATGVTWPNGYGAQPTFDTLGVRAIPASWVIGRDGRIAWSSSSGGTIEFAIEQALSQSK